MLRSLFKFLKLRVIKSSHNAQMSEPLDPKKDGHPLRAASSDPSRGRPSRKASSPLFPVNKDGSSVVIVSPTIIIKYDRW